MNSRLGHESFEDWRFRVTQQARREKNAAFQRQQERMLSRWKHERRMERLKRALVWILPLGAALVAGLLLVWALEKL
jgi:cell division septal protein FtsQ